LCQLSCQLQVAPRCSVLVQCVSTQMRRLGEGPGGPEKRGALRTRREIAEMPPGRLPVVIAPDHQLAHAVPRRGVDPQADRCAHWHARPSDLRLPVSQLLQLPAAATPA
jgi:hypothetical protein